MSDLRSSLVMARPQQSTAQAQSAGRLDLAWQGSLFDTGQVSYDPAMTGCRRRHLGEGAWVDQLPGWLGSADRPVRPASR